MGADPDLVPGLKEFDSAAYWESRLSSDYSLGGVGFSGLGIRYNRWLYRVRVAAFSRCIKSLYLPDSARVLDVGSGTGFMIETWLDAGVSKVSGCDISAVAVSNLALRFPECSFQQLDLGASAVPYSCEFDAISANDVLFHIVDDARYDQAIANVFAALRPGGYFVFTENFLHNETIRVEHHVSRTLEYITAVLVDAGFEILRRQPVFVLMNDPVDSASTFLRLWWRGLARVLLATPALGGRIGAVLYLPERLLGSVLTEGPSTELMLCRRPATRASAAS